MGEKKVEAETTFALSASPSDSVLHVNKNQDYQSLRGAGQLRTGARLRGSNKINRKGHARSQMFGARDQDIDTWKYLLLVSIFTVLYCVARRQFRAVKRYRTTRRNRDKATV